MLSKYANFSFCINFYQLTDTSAIAKSTLQNALTLLPRGCSGNFSISRKKQTKVYFFPLSVKSWNLMDLLEENPVLNREVQYELCGAWALLLSRSVREGN